jgi:hypothetical protein
VRPVILTKALKKGHKMDRRRFLVGAGSILSATFLTKAQWYLEKHQSIVPLLEPKKVEEVLYFVNTGFGYELRLNTVDIDLPQMTIREALELYHGISLPTNRALRLSEYRELYFEHGVMPKDLDKEADFDWWIDGWARTDSCVARAYRRLEHLELFDYSSSNGKLVGGLNFIDGCHPGNDYLGVTADDALSASLLQGRLLELEENIRVELVEVV